MDRVKLAVLKAAVTVNYKHPYLSIINWTRLLELGESGHIKVVPIMFELAAEGFLSRQAASTDIYDGGGWSLTQKGIDTVKEAIQNA